MHLQWALYLHWICWILFLWNSSVHCVQYSTLGSEWHFTSQQAVSIYCSCEVFGDVL